jgi:hypothetical protein
MMLLEAADDDLIMMELGWELVGWSDPCGLTEWGPARLAAVENGGVWAGLGLG